MTRILALCLGVVLGMAGCVSMLPTNTVEQRVEGYSVLVELGLGSHCTGTKIARHTLLIAAHCVNDYPGMVIVDGMPANVVRTHMDGGDQARIELDLTFDSFATVGKPPAIGDRIFIIGNPGELREILRRGYVAGSHREWLVADLNDWYGDSGSAVFNERGEVVGTIYGAYTENIFKIGLIQPVIAWQ